MHRRRLLAAACAVVPAGLLTVGCAATRTLGSEVSSFGAWPAERAPGGFAFDRLPSQAAQAAAQDAVEAAARPALAEAGFRWLEAGAEPEYLVQLGARVSRADRSPWDDPLWWRGGFGPWRYGPWAPPVWPVGPVWGRWPLRSDGPRYEREVAVLIRDRASGQPLYEARAVSDGLSPGGPALIAAMFSAAMKDFPLVQATPRRVTVQIAD